MKRPSIRTVVLAGLLLTLVSAGRSSAEMMEVPPDPRDRMSTLDDAVLQKQRALSAARRQGDPAAIERLTKEFNDIQQERKQILQKSPHLF